MGMEPEQEEGKRAVALAKAVDTAAADNLSAGVEARLSEILDRHWNIFRRILCDDPYARAEPLTGTFEPEAKVVKARGRVYSPLKTAWLSTCIGTLVALGLMFYKLQALWASVAMAVHKKGEFCVVSDYRAVNKQIEKVRGVMPNQEAEMANLWGPHVSGRLACCKDISRCHWRPKPRK